MFDFLKPVVNILLTVALLPLSIPLAVGILAYRQAQALLEAASIWMID